MGSREYEREGLTVHWDPEICIHSQVCWRSLPEVFKPSERPWVDIDGATADRIVATVGACPSGALSVTRTATEEPEESVVASESVSIHPQTNGPLKVEGSVQLMDADGNVVREGERFFLCRCGHSNSKPFCDGSHKKVGFRA